MSALTRVLTAPWRGWRRLRSLVNDEDHDDWLDRHRDQGSQPGGRYGISERVARYLSSGGGGSSS